MTPTPAMPPPPDDRDGLAHLRVQLRQLHDAAGAPSTRTIAARAAQPISHTTVATVLKCARPPRWAQLEAVVLSLNGDVEQFRAAWTAMRNPPAADGPDAGDQSELERLRAEVERLRQERDEFQARFARQPRAYPLPSDYPDPRRTGTNPVRATALRMILGSQLRTLRETAGFTPDDAGWEIRASGSKITRMEQGRVSFKDRDVADLLTMYGVTSPDEREAVLALVRQSQAPGWWQRFDDPMPGWLESYAALERRASLIRTCETQFVPGLLQTPDYARAVICDGHPGMAPEEIERRVELRMRRQRSARDGATSLWTVLHESVLRYPCAGPEVMRAQVVALLEAADRKDTRIQIVSGHVPVPAPFAILRFPERELPDIVHVELATSALYLDDRDEVDQYTAHWARTAIEAESLPRSLEVLRDFLRD